MSSRIRSQNTHMFADLFASHDLMDTLAPFLVATELPLCPLLGVSKAVRRAYLAAARETGLLRVRARLARDSEMEYTLHWHRAEPLQTYVDDDGRVQHRTVAPCLPLAWTVRARTPGAGDMVAAHAVPCCDLWRMSVMALALEGPYGASVLRNVMPYALLEDWSTSMYFVDDGSTTVYDLDELIFHLGLGATLEEFWLYFITPLFRTLTALREATVHLRVHTEAAGLARLGVAVES